MKYLFPMGFAKGALIGDVFVVQHLHKTMLSGSQEIGERGHTISSGRVPSSGAKMRSLLLCKSCALASAKHVPFSFANHVPSFFSRPPNRNPRAPNPPVCE